MARSSRRHAGTAPTPQSSTPESPEEHEEHTATVDNAEEESPDLETDLNDGLRVNDIEHEPGVPSETAQDVWDALKEDFYEQVEQLPLSLHRSFSLIGEQDKEVEACRAELLPTIRSYVKLRQSLLPNVSESGPAHVSDADGPTLSAPEPELEEALPTAQPEGHSDSTKVQEKEEDDVFSPAPLHAPDSNVASFTAKTSDSQPADQQSQSASARAPGVRETDASVPKSVPFPPRPKPKTTRELLTRIAFLMGEVIRASEEKVGLATAAYDSVDRHVRVLDSAIKEHEAANGTLPVGLPGISELDTTDPTLNPNADDEDEEPQLGMIGPSINPGKKLSGLRGGKKRDRRDRRIRVPPGNPTQRASLKPSAGNNELPIDPHEPRYCYCHQVSYGEMIACDNLDCRREWFHLECAGLYAPPKGKVKWYCRECEELRGTNKKRRLRLR